MSTTIETSIPPGFRAILSLAWPVALARAAQSVMGFCDAAVVKNLGEDSLAATTTGALNAASAFIFPMGVVYIVQSFASQMVGKGDLAGLRRQGFYGLAISLVAELVALAALPFVGPLLSRFDYTPPVRALMAGYLTIRLTSTGAAVGIEALSNWYGAQGNTRYGLMANVLVMVSNVALLLVLVPGGFGIPAMGVRGSALANVLATFLGFALLLALFARDVRKTPASKLKLSEFARVIRFGMPNGFNWFLEFAAFTVYVNVMFASLGTTALAALMSVLQLNSIAFMPAFGVSTAGAILVGNAIGAGAKRHVGTILLRTLAVTCTWMCSVGVLYLIAPTTLLSIFTQGDSVASFMAVGVPLLLVSAAWQLFDAAGMTFAESLRAAGDTAWCMWARIIIGWAVFVPASWLVVKVLHQGPTVTLGCLVGYLAILAVTFALRFRSGAWERIELVPEPTLDEAA